jgi:hypothetical protein
VGEQNFLEFFLSDLLQFKQFGLATLVGLNLVTPFLTTPRLFFFAAQELSQNFLCLDS